MVRQVAGGGVGGAARQEGRRQERPGVGGVVAVAQGGGVYAVGDASAVSPDGWRRGFAEGCWVFSCFLADDLGE